TAQSHKVIHNLLDAIDHEADRRGRSFVGLKKARHDHEALYASAHVKSSTSNAEIVAEAPQLVAGTAWLFARPDPDGTLDYLVIDEAGQVSLADAIATGTS